MKIKSKKLKNLLFICALLLFIPKVYADSDYETIDTTELYKKCNEKNGCVPVCIYSTIDKDFEYQNWKEEDKSYIGYYYSQGAAMKWEIGVLTYKASAKMTLDRFSGLTVPRSSIYFEDYVNASTGDHITWNNINEETNGINPYKDLSDDFKCPQYFYVDDQLDDEICFANQKEKCDSQDVLVKTDFGYARPLKFSLADEIKDVLNDTYNELTIFPSQYPAGADPDASKKIEFLAEVDSSFKAKYDAKKSARDNALNYCSVLQENLKSDDYISKISTKQEAFNKKIDAQLQASAEKYNVRNKSIYTDSILTSMLKLDDDENGNPIYRGIMDTYTNQNYMTKLHDIYGQNIRTSINYVRDICNSVPGNNIQYDENDFTTKIRKNYESKVFAAIQIDLKSQFSCNSLGELAGLVKTGYFIIEIAALIILIVFTSLDYAKVILSGEQDEMKKTNKRLATRIIIMVVLLLLPALINFTLRLFHIEGFNSENPLCVNLKEKDKTEKDK